MSFFTNIRADRLVTEIRSSNDPTGAATQKAVARLKDVGPGAIEAVLAALPDADKGSTMAFVEVLTGLVSQKTFPQFMRGLVEGSPRVISGISWALTSSRNYPPHLLLEALATPGISKPTVLEVIAAQKTRFGVRELLAAAYTQEPNEKAALFRVIGEIADQQSIPELIGRVQGKDPIARVHIINTLARFNTPEVQTALQGLLKDPNKLIRGATLSALQRMNGPIDIERVCALLRDAEIDVLNRAIDGPVENVDLRIPQQRAHALDINGSVHALQRRQRGPPDQLVGIFQQSLQRSLHLGRVKARQGVDDVHARDGVLALHAADQLGDGLLVGDHVEHRGLGDSRCRERFEQHVRRIVAAAGQCPGNSGDHARTAFHQSAHELRKCLLADEAREHLDECHGGALVGIGQGA